MIFRRDNLFTVRSTEVNDYRPHLLPLLRRMEQANDHVSAEDVFSQAERAEAQLWGYAVDGEVKAMAATRIHTMAKGKLCSIWVCVGFDVLDIMNGAHEEIEKWARSIGCYAIEIVGRKGWGRVLPGYVQTSVVYEKSLEKVH